jgi:hypothetical protein
MKMEKKLFVLLVQEKQIKKKGFFMSNIKEREKFDDYEMLKSMILMMEFVVGFMNQKRYLFH